MIRLRTLLFISCLTLCLASGGAASERCDPDDGNNDRENAAPMEYGGRVVGVVCPDDPYDFYVLRVAKGDGAFGRIVFSSNQPSTILRIEHAESGMVFVDDKTTTEDELQFIIDVPEGKLRPGTYYARVSFEPGADYDHVYTLWLDLKCKTAEGVVKQFAIDERADRVPIYGRAAISNQPWPMARGNSFRNGRSTYPGPGAIAKFSWLCDIFYAVGPCGTIPEDRWMVFQDLLVNSTNYFFSIVHYKDIETTGFTSEYKKYVYHGYHTVMGNLAFPGSNGLPGNLSMETCLDPYGNLFRTYPLALKKYEFNYDDYDCAWSCVWSSDIPYCDTLNYDEGYRYLTNLVGKRIYLHRGIMGGPFYITAFDHGGGVAWHSEMFNNPLYGMMEDPDANLYLRVFNEGLYKLAPDGRILWHVLQDPYQMKKQFTGVAPRDKSGLTGPIYGDDGRIWVCTLRGLSTAAQYHVFNPDGSQYKSCSFGAGIDPCVCCCGDDGRFYVATSNLDVRCYNDWDELVWSTALAEPIITTGLTAIQDMVMDSNNMIYVLLYRAQADTHNIEFFAINPNGEIVSDIESYLPYRAGPENELAIGNDKKLVCLNSAGYVGFASGFEIDPGAIKSKIRLEAKDG
jgi:hypothetical protein